MEWNKENYPTLFKQFDNFYDELSVLEGALEPISFTIAMNEKEFTFEIETSKEFNFAEYGRKPGKMPPINKIKVWIKEQGISPRSINGELPNLDSLAYLIARKIGKLGTRGEHLFTPLLDRTINKYIPIFELALKNDMETQLNEDELFN